MFDCAVRSPVTVSVPVILSEPVIFTEPVALWVSVEILPSVTPVFVTCNSTELADVTVKDPVMLESPCEKNPFFMTNSLGILYLFPIQD